MDGIDINGLIKTYALPCGCVNKYHVVLTHGRIIIIIRC